MPLFGDADSFRSCQFETYAAVNTVFTSNGDSIYQYSHTQKQRTNEARRRIDQRKEKQNAVNDKENVEITISEDLADGHIAKLDASLKLLGEDDQRLFLPSDELEDDEIHIIETTIGGNHALHDYQMQLMLLEQVNKRRLVMARARREPNNPENEAKRIRSDQFAATRVFKRRYETNAIEKGQIQAAMTRKRSRDLKAEVTPKRLAMDVDTGLIPTTKRQKRRHRPRTQLSEVDNSDVVNDSDLNPGPAESGERMPPHFDLLYKISCNEDYSRRHSHPVPAFRDAPVSGVPLDSGVQMSSTRSHLNGTIPVFDLEAFMEDDSDDFAFVVIRTVECSEASVLMARAGGPLRWTEAIYTKSKISKNTMQQIATCHFQPILNEKEPAKMYASPPPLRDITAPFEQNQIARADLFLFHHRQLLRTYASEHSESRKHIDALFEYMDNRFGMEYAEADSLFARGLVTYAHVLKLFKPNELIISGSYGRPAAFVLQDWPELGSGGWVTLSCWSFQTDGSGFARKRSVLSIPPIEPKPTKIQNLAVFPLHFAPPELRELIRSRGEKQWELRTTTQITYQGWNVGKDQFFPDARFMIDHKIYLKMHEYAQAFRFDKPTTTHPFDRMPAYLSVEQEPSDISFLLMPPDIHGFYLNEKKWIKLFVDCIQPVSWNTKAYERLVLPPQTKDLVRALVTVRSSQRGVKQGLGVAGKRTDITGGKGNGLIMLLHGGPGTGKTLTAESVAEIAHMPLYRVTCGDIGTNAEAVEKYLNTVLHLGKTWNCVLLLDEADVFLEERSMADMKRNSLVSVFLRILEYYDGILILTSNRVGVFDEAFKSRIQVALHYENLNRPARKKIWQNFLDMLEEDEENVNFDEIKLHLDQLAGNDLNGRQIRNVLTTARQLAIFRNERLDWEHLEQALSVSSNFNEYLKRIQPHSDDQRARDEGLR